MSKPPLRCLVADDHPAVRAVVVALLLENGFEVVGPVGDGEEAVALALAEQPELAVIDFRMPRLAGADLLRRLHAVSPGTRLAVYTGEADDGLAREALEAGASALVLKEAPLEDLLRALEAVLAGRPYVDAALAGFALAGRGEQSGKALTAREADVLRLLAEGLSHDEIGERLSIGGETVRTHVRKACNRLGAATRTQAVAIALRDGLIT